MLCLMLRSKCFSGRAYFHCTQWATDTECSPPRTQVHSFIHGAEIHKCICNSLYKQSTKFSTSSLAWNHELCRLTCSLWVRFSFKILPLFPLSLKKKTSSPSGENVPSGFWSICGHGCHNNDLSYEQVWPPFFASFCGFLACSSLYVYLDPCSFLSCKGLFEVGLCEGPGALQWATYMTWKILGQQDVFCTFFGSCFFFFALYKNTQ